MAVHSFSKTNGIGKTVNIASYPGKSITETITNGFFTVDDHWTVLHWNKAAEKFLGVQAKDMIGKNLWSKFAGQIPVEFYSVYHKAFLQDGPLYFEEYWGETGTWFDVITYYNNDKLSVSFKTCTKTEQSDQPLRIRNELYRFITEVTNDCLWEWDIQAGEIFWIDGGHKRVFGYPIENALIPKSFWESRLHPDDKKRIFTRLDKIIADASVCEWEDEYRFQKANGDYACVHDRAHIIYDADKKAARMIGATQDITQKILLEKQLIKERLAKQKEITSAVMTALENERAYIGEELHDNLGQILVVANMYMQMAKVRDKNWELYIEKSCGFIKNVIEEIRKISKKLVIPGTSIIGLFDNISNLLHDLAIVHPIKIEFHKHDLREDELDENLQLTIYRIVQEQMNNILKHANATRAVIDLSRQTNQIILLISDNGNGCDILKEKKGVGIININSRAELYNGYVRIASKPGEGYELKVVLSPDDLVDEPETGSTIPEEK